MKRYQLRSRAPKTMEELVEGPDIVRSKVQELANMIRTSKYTVVYTGAGISTAAGIPDYRGPSGVWTLRAQGKNLSEPDFEKVEPTFSHVALKRLLDAGQVRHIISQNIDGLHLRSGIFPDNLSELHGNYSLETCPDCKAAYFRSYAVWSGLASTPEPNLGSTPVEQSPSPRQNKLRKGDGGGPLCSKPTKSSKVDYSEDILEQQISHVTGRKCEKEGCSGSLEDSVIQFWEDIPQQVMTAATKHSQKADLGIVLGSSLRVTPACDLPAKILGNGGRVVIVNLQSTPLDGRASLVIHATCDQVMQMLLEELSPPSRTAVVVGESEKSSAMALSKREGDPPSDQLLLSLNWQVPGACLQTKGRDEQAFEDNGGRGLEFERTLLVSIGSSAPGL